LIALARKSRSAFPRCTLAGFKPSAALFDRLVDEQSDVGDWRSHKLPIVHDAFSGVLHPNEILHRWFRRREFQEP
jgi:hypothetical protein